MGVIGIDRGEDDPFEIDTSLFAWVDVLHPSDGWLEAQVVSVDHDRRRIHYKGLVGFYDEWLHKDSSRISRLHSHTPSFNFDNEQDNFWRVFDRLSVLDSRDQWSPAEVVDVAGSRIKVHYLNHLNRYDEWINANSYRLRKPDSRKAEYPAPLQSSPRTVNKKALFRATVQDEDNFRTLLRAKLDAEIVEMDYDGNCLFRAISHQVYGDPRHHFAIRNYCCDYMEREQDFFSNYVTTDDFGEYLARMRCDGIWGDHLEIQAMSEIYERPILVYAYSADPMKSYSNQFSAAPPIRISYHFESHYNSIVIRPPASVSMPQLSVLERKALSRPSNRIQEQITNLNERIDSMEVESAINESLTMVMEEECKMASLIEMDAVDDLKTALDESRRAQEASDSVMLREALALSSMDVSNVDEFPYPIQYCHIELNFPLDICVAAYQTLENLLGNDEAIIEQMISWILDQG
uniref:ubiquitinyl hydrolase 1 n=1 Tax=Spongospora subterranea TaxID=70186 RepID=A0A0H5R904_9EUKA|eukprot:CRZ10605.1 hypothetical protein [Spongospora subterranea]